MKTALDTNILSGLWSAGPLARGVAAFLADCKAEGGLVICGAVYAELLAHPKVSPGFLDGFLRDAAIECDFSLAAEAWRLAGSAFASYALRRKRGNGGGPRRILADFIVGAHAQLCADRLATLDSRGYQVAFAGLALIAPAGG